MGGLAFIAVLAAGGCNYGFRSGSFPDHIRTVAILPFENDTNRFELSQEIHEELLRELPRALGVTNAGEDVADAVVQGRIVRYDMTTPLFRSNSQQVGQVDVLQRQVSIRVEVELIDLVENLILWDDRGLSTQGQYLEGESEEIGRAEAIELLVQRIVDGAQSNW